MRADKVRTTIEVANCIDAIDLVEHLNTLGFSARVYREGDPEKDTQDSHAIWVGSLISPVIAIQVIKEAVEIWPFLEYLHLSQDSAGPEYIDHEIFIGGSTSTAEGYGLRPWTPDEIQGFPDEMPLEQFHALVRSKYPPEALKVRSPRRKELVEMKKRRPRSSRGVAQSE
jgi:hypothetical protein